MDFFEISLEFSPDNTIDKKVLEGFPLDQDIVVYSGGIGSQLDKTLINILEEKGKKTNVLFLLATYGGDADAAYRTAKFFRRRYKDFTLGILGDCKSAGTIIALGAHHILMCARAELGPLDVQMYRPDEFVQMTSGMTISQALSYVSTKAFDTFEDIFLAIRRRSGGIITTQTAADIATNIVTGLYSPITAKIDPMRVGEMQRSMEIAVHYGKRLGAKPEIVEHLAHNYPSHSFVIDFDEAKDLFDNVRGPTEAEEILFLQLMKILKAECGGNHLRVPSGEDFAALIDVKRSDKKTQNKENGHAGAGNSQANTAAAGKRRSGRRKTSTKKVGNKQTAKTAV